MSAGIGFVAGSFDLLHAGHVLLLKEAKEHCKYLIVALQSDPTIDRAWKNKPIQSLEERFTQLEAIKYVDRILPYDTEKELSRMLQGVAPCIRFLGDDYKGKDYTGCKLPIPIHWISRNHGYSSSDLRKRIFDAENTKALIEMGMY